jgi:K+-transporting ATPase KdpF subunit
MGTNSVYVAGALIALLILGYLIYTLIKPQNF